MDYLQFWNLQSPVFLTKPSTDQLFFSKTTKIKIDRLLTFAQQPGMAMSLNGVAGIGTTSVAEWLYHNCKPLTQDTLFFSLVNSELNPGWLLSKLGKFMGIRGYDRPPEVIADELKKSFDQYTTEKRHLLIIIDNSEVLQENDRWKEVKTLFSSQSALGKCLSILLVGKNNMTKSLQIEGTFQTELSTLSAQEVALYLANRCEQSGLKRDTFPEEISNKLWKLSQGVFSSLNTLAESCLIEACRIQSRIISSGILNEVSVSSEESEASLNEAPETAVKEEDQPIELLEREEKKKLEPTTDESEEPIGMANLFKESV